MAAVNRRDWLRGLGLGIATAAAGSGPIEGAQRATRPNQAGEKGTGATLRLVDFQPRSMLHVDEHIVERPRFPLVDVHTHLSFTRGDGTMRYSAGADEVLPVMERRGIRTMVNLTGGSGEGLAQTIARYDRAHPGRFLTFTEPTWRRASEPGYARWQGDEIAAAKRAGAHGLKVLKTLGLYLRDGGPSGKLVAIDDPRFDPMWEACGSLGLPVAIHIADPEAFFLPTDRFNERYEELANHPDWSFHGPRFPTFDALLDACDRVFAKHPKTTFIALHVGHDAENLGRVADRLKRLPNMYVELAARIGELGRQPRAARRFFETWQDRILFGTDAIPHGTSTPQQVFGDDLYKIYFRFLETEDEYFDYAPAPVPPQGRWRIYGLGLPEPILKKVYSENARRLLDLAE